MSYPDDRRYTREHEWVQADGGVARVGLTTYATRELGEIVFVELPAKGRRVEAGDELGTVESVKAVAEVFAPVTGEIVEPNESVGEDPEFLNDDPHGEGWLVRIRMSAPGQLDRLMSAAQYEEFIRQAAE